uniref:EOG090X0464 n=1 Tax=Evadne anonyx TaxID=141404 RepID=A0A9N6ZEX6_9CRUS|nr:EOG090X0464 [Evadne anonyx]
MQEQEEIITLSSDEEDEQIDNYLQNILKKTEEVESTVGTQSNSQSESPITFQNILTKEADHDTKRKTAEKSMNLPSVFKREEIFSSDDEEDQFENYLKNVLKKLEEEKSLPEKGPLTSSFINDESLSDDSYDAPSVFESLQNKLRTPVEPSMDSYLLIRSKEEKTKKTSSKTEKENIFRPPKNPPLKSKPKEPPYHRNRKVSNGADSDLEDIFGDLNIDDVPVKTKSKKSSQVATESFLASLSVDLPENRRHSDAVPYVKSFRKLRTELTHKLFKLFNEAVFQNQLPQGFPLTWNKRLTRTAGFCRHFTKRENGIVTFESSIELSVKVVDTPCRLRDTLVHEMCHAATWMIDNYRAAGHGPVWKKYARLVNRVFPELPVVTRCHNYEITYKFYYNCGRCYFSTGRHSKSIDTTTHVCPYCRGTLQLSTEPRASTGTPKTPRAPNAFALFVKANFAVTKASRPDLPHGEIMKILSSKFAESKKQSVEVID